MKIYKIECCAKCPKFGCSHNIKGSYFYCYMQHEIINYIDTIPKWCPLPDWKGEK